MQATVIAVRKSSPQKESMLQIFQNFRHRR